MAKYEEQSHGFPYDVFLSFRGEDTRHNIVGYLLDAFEKRRINVFYDDKKLELGEDISTALGKAIEESNISVIVLSENYASSRWCLGELVKIMECTRRNKKQIAFPIFYHVDPSDVRNQRNSYGKAMVAHEKRFGKKSEKIKAWRAALTKVADLKGHHIHTGFEIDHVKEIAEKVRAKIPPKSLLDGENPVGLDQRIEEVKSLLDLKPNDDMVCTLGIYGLGGIGKTSLAKALYNKIAHQFQAACFLANVREKSYNIKGLEDLQLTLLSEMFEQADSKLGSTSRGINEIKDKLGKKKALLVIDDVNKMEQLENLAGGSDWFGPGSRIIITTRDKGLLIGTYPIEVTTYEMTELNDQLSLELFCQIAFRTSHPKTEYEAMSSRAIGYAKGLPLALKVIGSNLRTRQTLNAWEDALKDYERIPRKEIQDVLKVSYDMLEPHAQSVFLDIVYFFKGKSIEYVEEILEEFSAASNIVELVNKSLMNVDDGYLNMHDLIQDMGREIVRQEAPNNPAKRSRLWFHQDVTGVSSSKNFGSDAIQGIMFDPPYDMPIQMGQRDLSRKIKVNWKNIAFEKMHHLRILIVRGTDFLLEPKHLPDHLRLLDWEEYPSKTLPPKFYPENIIILNLRESKFTIKKPFEQFSNLTVMDLSYNLSITTMPDVSKVQNLRELRLDHCENLTTVHESIGFLKHLVHLSASRCTFKNFLQRMFLPALELLHLNYCENLEHFPDILNKMDKPLTIYMSCTSIMKLPNSVDNLIGLVSINMYGCEKLEYIPSSLFRLPNVVAFNFGYCYKLDESLRTFLHDSPSEANEHSSVKRVHFSCSGSSDEDIHKILVCYPKLEELNVSGSSNLVSLPACIKEFNHLTKLDVSYCKKLKEIPECTNLRILNVSYCESLTHISELPCTIQEIDARECFKFSSQTSDMLWCQVKKERHRLKIVMPTCYKVPKWFDHRCKGGMPCLWVHEKFPINVALALMFPMYGLRKGVETFELELLINGQYVSHKRHSHFDFADHVVVCDLRHLFNDEEWSSLDVLLLKHEWNQVQISYNTDSNVTLNDWGAFVYKQGTDNLKEHVRFMCPDPTSEADSAAEIVAAEDPDRMHHVYRHVGELMPVTDFQPIFLPNPMAVCDELETSWTCPPLNWIKLNCHGAAINGINAGCGGVMRNSNGDFISAFAVKLGNYFHMEAGLLAIFHGIELVWDKGFKQLIIESDCMDVVGCIQRKIPAPDEFSILLAEIFKLISLMESVKINQVCPNANKVANVLAKRGAIQTFQCIHYFDVVPEFCNFEFQEDRELALSEVDLGVSEVNLEEHVQFSCPEKDPIITIEEFKHEDSNDAAVNENRDDKIIGLEDIPSPTAPEVDETGQHTPMFEENEEHVTHSNEAFVHLFL